MVNRKKLVRRHGTALVESAFALSATLILVIGLLVGALGVFRYQEMAYVARETARYASVHGMQFATNSNGGTAITQDNLITYAKGKCVALDTSRLTVTVTMTVFAPGATTSSVNPPDTTTVNWDTTATNQNHSPYSSWTRTPTGEVTTAANLVTVTVSYPWVPEAFGIGPYNLTSTTVMAMSW